jgi:hypothetical protein
VPAAPREAKPSRLALGIGIGGLAVSAIGVVGWVMARRQITDFSNAKISGTTFPDKTVVTADDCGEVTFADPALQQKFEGACGAKDRQAWLAPATLISGTVGIVALTYYFWTKPKRAHSMAITPTASGGMMATFEW